MLLHHESGEMSVHPMAALSVDFKDETQAHSLLDTTLYSGSPFIQDHNLTLVLTIFRFL
jgi:hypothetical protein